VECRFAWDEGKYPTMSPLKDIVSSIHALVAKIEDDMKVLSWHIFLPLILIAFNFLYLDVATISMLKFWASQFLNRTGASIRV
jgi:V-ATPase subunit C